MVLLGGEGSILLEDNYIAFSNKSASILGELA
jgi:hypothetical protein